MSAPAFSDRRGGCFLVPRKPNEIAANSLCRPQSIRPLRKTPKANAICERWIGSARRECLDFMIPINETHIRQTLKCWVEHYNRVRPHSSLGPGTPDPTSPKADLQAQRHCIPKDCRVAVTSILSGLHHEYRLQKIAA